MADQIGDNRTLLFDGGDGTGGQPDSLAGAATGSTDTSTFIEGSTSYTISLTDSILGMLVDAGSAQDYSNSHFYFTINCGVVGLLLAKASGGCTARFCGDTVTDFFEVYIGGNDSWPESIQGGWVNFVVDIEEASNNPSNSGGTPPATNAIRYVGVTGETSIMPKMADNFWFDTLHRLPYDTPGIIIEGRDGGATDWDSADILTELGSGQMAFRAGPGGSYVLSTPIQFGIDDASTHGFTATNDIWLWDDQEWAKSDLYGISALGNSGGTTNVTFGVKTGTGDDATGAQGLTIAAAAAGIRWSGDFDDPDLDLIGLYGCNLSHGSDFQLDDAAVSVISTQFLDCTSARVDNAGDFLRNKIINANTADGVAFIVTDDISDIVFCEFEFSDGHAIEITTPLVASQTSKGNKFTGYGGTPGTNLVPNSGSTDAAIYNDSGLISFVDGDVELSVTDLGDTPSVRNGADATTVVTNTKTLTVQVNDDSSDANAVEGARVRIEAASGGALISEGSTNSSGTYTDTTYAYGGDIAVVTKVRLKGHKNFRTGGTIDTNGLSVGVRFVIDKIVDLP